jgi:hypothetical protein
MTNNGQQPSFQQQHLAGSITEMDWISDGRLGHVNTKAMEG